MRQLKLIQNFCTKLRKLHLKAIHKLNSYHTPSATIQILSLFEVKLTLITKLSKGQK